MVKAENYLFSMCLGGSLWEMGEAQICCVRTYSLDVGIQILATAKKDTGASEFFLKTLLLCSEVCSHRLSCTRHKTGIAVGQD